MSRRTREKIVVEIFDFFRAYYNKSWNRAYPLCKAFSIHSYASDKRRTIQRFIQDGLQHEIN